MIDGGLVQSSGDPENGSSNIPASVSFHLLTPNLFLHRDSVCHRCERQQPEISLSEIPRGYAKPSERTFKDGKPV